MNAGERMLNTDWTLTLSEPGTFATPGEIPPSSERLPASVPGTVASTLRAAGRFDACAPTPLENIDAWYRLDLSTEAPGPAVLQFAGLATIAEVYLGEELILRSDSMFETHRVPVALSRGQTLAICFRAFGPHLDRKGPRARWRPRMMRSQGLRLLRTTALGFMPGWCPDVVAIGPWRAISLSRETADDIRGLKIAATLDENGCGTLKIQFDTRALPGDVRLHCDGRETVFVESDGHYSAELDLPGIEPWWPQSHGRPVLHDLFVTHGDHRRLLARTGFRRIDVDRGADGNDFALLVNGVRVFCRGAVWTTADITALPGDRKAYEPWLRLAAEAGMNMIRIPGVAAYETVDFFQLCDELGIMVWQDLMFANFDYPVSDPDFVIHVKTEVGQLLDRLQASPSLVVVCGGSEVFQQGAMLGLPERMWKTTLATDTLAAACADGAAGAIYVENSPSGGALPFFPNAGIAHYYGVGAYCRPLDDARHANIRFAAECLAFSNVPDPETLSQHMPLATLQDASWKARVPRDVGASWDFEDVREHYLRELYQIDPARMRYEDPDRYLAFSRAVTAEVREATFAEWRRPGSSCNGALVWTLQDLLAGAGWGVIDATGRPKSAWYALKRAFRPLQVIVSDEGTNGLDVHVLNENGEPADLIVELACLRNGRQVVVSGQRAISVEARQTMSIAATDLFGAFFDTTYAYRFGPPSHDVTVARLTANGQIVAEAFHFPLGRAKALHDAAIEASLMRGDDGIWTLQLQADRLAQSVTISADGYRLADNGFHLAPGMVKRVALLPLAVTSADTLPGGTIGSLGSDQIIRF